MIHSYPSIFNMGHKAIADLLKGPVLVEEKVDGSQFSFMVDMNGEVVCRSKGAQLNLVAPEGMFQKAIEVVMKRKGGLSRGWTYRGEYLQKPKHNALTYDRTPNDHIILFDINNGLESYLTREEKEAEAARIGLEIVPVLYSGMIEDVQKFRDLLETESILGGQKIEGVVVKPLKYELFGSDKKVLMGKFVSEHFREVHAKEWNADPNKKSGKEFIQLLTSNYCTPARWAKALIHLEEKGLIQSAPQDIGLLMKEVPDDVLKECEVELKDQIFKWAWPTIKRGLTRGLPEWYKEELLKKQFDASSSNGRTPDFDSGNGGSTPPEAN